MTATSTRRFNAAFGLLVCAALAACGGGDDDAVTPVTPITASADTFTLAAGQTADLLANDRLGTAAATLGALGNVSFALTGAALPQGVTVTNGIVAVDASALPAPVSIGYRLCEAANTSNCATATAQITISAPPTVGSLTGRAIDAATSLGVAGVQVSVGSLSTTTDADGGFTLNGVTPSARVAVRFSATTHGETVRIAEVAASRSTNVQARIVAVGVAASVTIASANTVTVPGSPAQVVLPAASVQRADGSLPTGNMQVRLTPIDPASDTSLMPGDFTTLVAGTPTPIESYGALDVQLADASGAALNLRPGQSATIRIPLSSRSSTAPATIPLFYFDAAAGRWVQEGTATLAGTAPARYYEGTVTHFTTWNADIVSETVLVSGCVADAAGARIADALVATDGVDYSGTTSARTDASGNFSVAMRRNSQATLVAVAGGLLSNTLRIGPYNVNAQLSECLALGQTGAGITMKLTWGALPDDLDSHLILPDGTHIYYGNEGNLINTPYVNLDVDDTSSYGPEVITITKLMVGTYKYSIRNFTGYSGGPIGSASARVELNIPGRAAELYTPPATGESALTDYWNLFELDVDARCNVTVRRVGSFSQGGPSNVTATPTYCTP